VVGGFDGDHVLPSAFAPGAHPVSTRSDFRSKPTYHTRSFLLAKTPRTWTGARTPSGLKRVRQAARRHEILGPRRSAAKTYVAKALAVAGGGDAEVATAALTEALSALDRAAKAGAIHANAAARRKSRLTRSVNAALGGASVQTSGRVVKQTGKAAAAKAAKARIAASKSTKAKGAQTAAGKARAAFSKTARAEAAAAKAAGTSTTATTAEAPAKTTRAPAKATAAKKTTTAKAASKSTTKASATKTATAKATTAKAAPKKKAAAKS
jgi:ribosomal protein S20